MCTTMKMIINTPQLLRFVFVLMLYPSTVTASWEPLLVYNVTHATSLSPIQAWEGRSSIEATNLTIDELLPIINGDAPYVSPLINDWSTVAPLEVLIMAVIYESGIATVLLAATLHIQSNRSDFHSWMKSSALTNYITERGRIDLISVGAVFKYEYVSNVTTGAAGGIALLWDDRMSQNKALLLTSTEGRIGDIDDIRNNMQTHTLAFSTSVTKGVLEWTSSGERINSTNFKIVPLNSRYSHDVIVSLTYELDPGVILSAVMVWHSGFNEPYQLDLHYRNGVGITFTSKKYNDTFYVGDICNGVQFVELQASSSLGITDVRMQFNYSYLPYNSANFLVVLGFYSPGPDNDYDHPVIGTAPTTSVISSSNPTLKVPIVTDTLTTSLATTSEFPISAQPLTPSPVSVINSSSGNSEETSTIIETTPVIPEFVSVSSSSSDYSQPVQQVSYTSHTTFRQVSQTGPSSSCAQDCSCKKAIWDSISMASLIASGNKTAIERILTLLDELKIELTVNKSALTSYRMKKVSAMDMRTSTNSIGSFGIVIIVGAVSAIVFLDIAVILLPK